MGCPLAVAVGLVSGTPHPDSLLLAFAPHPRCDLTHPEGIIACGRCAELWAEGEQAHRRLPLAFGLWTAAFVLAVLSIPAPNGLPLLIGAFVLYGLAWHFYKPKENR